MKAHDVRPVAVFHEGIDVLRRGGAVLDVVRVLVHVERQDGRRSGHAVRMIGRPLIHELAIAVRMREQHPAGSPTVGIMCPCCWWCLRNVLSSAATFMGTPRLLNRCALQDRHTTGVAARLLTSRLSFENYGPITTDTPPGSAGNRRDTRTPVWAPARSRSSVEEPALTCSGMTKNEPAASTSSTITVRALFMAAS